MIRGGGGGGGGSLIEGDQGGGSLIEGDQGRRGSLTEGDQGGGEGVTYRGVIPMHKCCVGRVVKCTWWWLHTFPASSCYKRYAR